MEIRADHDSNMDLKDRDEDDQLGVCVFLIDNLAQNSEEDHACRHHSAIINQVTLQS